MKNATYDRIDKYTIEGYTTAPVHVGGGTERDGILLHPDSRIPYIQASSICGVMRSYCRLVDQKCTSKIEDVLFGNSKNDTESRVKVTDLAFIRNSNLRIEVRPHVKIDKDSGTVSAKKTKGIETYSGQKFEMEYIGAGAEFVFSIYLYDATKKEKSFIEDALAAFNCGELQFGAKKSNGCGDVRLSKIRCGSFDMKKAEDRERWIKEDDRELKENKEILKKSSNKLLAHQNAYEITISAQTEEELLVKGIVTGDFGETAPKAENMRNVADKYIVPGSSVKGAVKNRIEMIAEYLGISKEIVDSSFGSEITNDSDGKSGKVLFKDIVFDKKVNEKLHPRIKIDKFTGGVIHGGLFTELAIAGDMEIKIILKQAEHTEAMMALLLLALRDLAAKLYAIGSGQNIGRGYINIDKIHIDRISDGKECTLNSSFTVSSDEETEMIDGFLQALQNCRAI